MDKRLVGEYGEVIASRYLRRHGYIILEGNYKCKFGEIDIIAEDRKYVCFVEVKTRSENMKYLPSDAVDAVKRAKIIASSQLYLMNYDERCQPRFDIIEAFFENDEPVKINHIENAFDANGN